MLDAIQNGTGNSRLLKSVSDFYKRYPTYDAFADAISASGIPIDLADIILEGWAQLGMPLDKANLLTDATAALMGLGDEATPNDMFAALAGRITFGTQDLTAGVSPLADGVFYFVYKP